LWVGQLRQDAGAFLHDLLLQRARGLNVHGGGAGLVGVLNVGETEGTATVRVLLELGDGGSRVVLGSELDDTGTTRATVGLVLDFSTLDLADGGEELDQVLVAGAPGQVADVDDGTRIHARGGEVGERVRGSSGSSRSAVTSSARGSACEAARRATVTRSTTVAAAAVASSETTATSKACARAEATTATIATVEAATAVATSEAAATAEATAAVASAASETVLTDLEETAGPVVAVELLNGVLGVFRSLEGDDTRALGSAIRSHVDVGADDGACQSD
jgi:hypothetical protein